MKKYIIKGNEVIYKNCRSTNKPDPNKQGYLESYWYFGFEEYSFKLTKDITKAKVFDTRKEAENAISIIGFKIIDTRIISIELKIKLID